MINLKGLVSATVLSLGLLVVLIVFFRPQSEPAILSKCFEKNGNNSKFYILGHCESQYGLNPNLLVSKGFNLGLQYQNLHFTKNLVEKLIPVNSEVDTILIGINPIEFFGFYVAKGEFLRESFLLFGSTPAFFKYYSHFFRSLLDYYYYVESHLFGNRDTKRIIVVDKESQVKTGEEQINPAYVCENGYVAVGGSLNVGDIESSTHDFIEGFDLNSPYKFRRVIEEILETPALKGKKILIYTSPWVKGMKSVVKKKVPNLDQYRLIAKDIVNKHDNVYFFDMNELEGFETKDFWEPSILNHRGSKKFSLMMKIIMEKLPQLDKRYWSSGETLQLVERSEGGRN